MLGASLVLAAWLGVAQHPTTENTAPPRAPSHREVASPRTESRGAARVPAENAAAARSVDRPQLLFITRLDGGCLPCERFKRTVLRDPRVQAEIATHFEYLEVDWSAYRPSPPLPEFEVFRDGQGTLFDPALSVAGFLSQVRAMR